MRKKRNGRKRIKVGKNGKVIKREKIREKYQRTVERKLMRNINYPTVNWLRGSGKSWEIWRK